MKVCLTGEEVMDQLSRNFNREFCASVTARISRAAMTVGDRQDQRRTDPGFRQPADRILVRHSRALVCGSANALTNNLPLWYGLFSIHGMSDKLQFLVVTRQTEVCRTCITRHHPPKSRRNRARREWER